MIVAALRVADVVVTALHVAVIAAAVFVAGILVASYRFVEERRYM